MIVVGLVFAAAIAILALVGAALALTVVVSGSRMVLEGRRRRDDPRLVEGLAL
jgi:hypothetical protein